MNEINVDVKAQKDRYISYMMKKLPEAEKGDARTLKKGDSLWNIAKEAVGGSKATNAEISEYMLLLAKANGLDSYDKMNSLKVADTIYMPKVSAVKTETKIKAPTQPKQLTSAEESAKEAISKILNSKDVTIQKVYYPNNMYHVYVKRPPSENYGVSKSLVLSFTYSDGKISNVTFEDNKENIFTSGADYRMEADGRIYQRNRMSEPQVGKIDKENVAELKAKLESLLPYAKLVF